KSLVDEYGKVSQLPKRWSIHGYYEFRKRQSDFSGDFHKESNWLKINLKTIANKKENCFNKEQVERAKLLLLTWENQLYDPNVATFWEEIRHKRELEVTGILNMFEATNVSQQHIVNIQHQDLLSIYQPCGAEQVNTPVMSLQNILNSPKKRKNEDNIQESWSKSMMESNDSNLSDEFDWSFNNAHSQEELDERVKLPTCYNQENENKENVPTYKKTKKRVKSAPNTKNPRPGNDSEKSSEFPPPFDVEFEDDVELKFDFTNIERELLRESTNEWVFGEINVSQKFRKYQIEQMITRENPYTITDPVLPMEVLPLLRNALADSLEGKTTFLSLSDSEIGRVVSRIFNDICGSVPDVSPTKTSEDEHCFKLLHPIIRPLFFTSSYKEYNIRLNRATSGTATRPDFSCLVNEIPVLNSEIKPPGFTPLQQQKDKLKVQMRGRKSINQLLRTKGGPPETVLLINQGDLVESYVMDLKYDGLYRSWPFLTTRLVKDKTTIPLLESNIRHFMALEERINRIAEDYNRRTCQ
ncbi:10049_t:CDS:10, partial [Diversispora eburnea]